MSTQETPLVKKRNTVTPIGSVLSQIQKELNIFIKKSEQISNAKFFSSNQNNLRAETKKIVEQTLTLVKNLKKEHAKISSQDALKNLGDILLQAKYQALLLSIKTGERPVTLNYCLDKCISLFTNQAVKVSDNQETGQLFKSLLIIHEALAIKELYDQYHEKTLAMCVESSHDNLAVDALNRFHKQLSENNADFLKGLEHFTHYFEPIDKTQSTSVTPEIYSEISIFLKDQNRKILELEPPSEDLKIPVVSRIYRWGITAVSKVTDYMRGLNKQFISEIEPNLALKHK